jgi:hypothetical protein
MEVIVPAETSGSQVILDDENRYLRPSWDHNWTFDPFLGIYEVVTFCPYTLKPRLFKNLSKGVNHGCWRE